MRIFSTLLNRCGRVRLEITCATFAAALLGLLFTNSAAQTPPDEYFLLRPLCSV
jgi:hypothetical protein